MAIELMDELEQGEIVRNWLKQNLNAIIIGILVGIGGLMGWQQYKAMKLKHAAAAQTEYLALTDAIAKKDADATAKLNALLRGKYSDTPYAFFAALSEAQQALLENNADVAAKALTWARDNADLPALRDLASLRLARIKLAQGDAQGAITLASAVESGGYKAIAAELRGDALVILKRNAEAQTAYDEALTALDAAAPQRAFVQMKRDDLAKESTGS